MTDRLPSRTPRSPNTGSSPSRTRTWAGWVRGAVLVLGTAASLAIGFVATLVVRITAVVLDAAPLGLAGEQQETAGWVVPAAIIAGLVAFLLGLRATFRIVRAHAP